MIKFDPIYRVTIYSNEATVIVIDPITCNLHIERGLMSNAVRASIQLYNLAPSTREKIFQDPLTIDYTKWKFVHVEAGYGGNYNTMSMIFKGRILQAYSQKAGGQVDVITHIEAQALDIFDCYSAHTFAAGTSFKEIVKTCVNDLPNVTLGNIGALEGTVKTETTCDGKTFEQIEKITGGHAYVDNGVLNVLMNNEVLDVPVPVITDSSGLLETPVRRDAYLDIKMLFEPTLVVGQLLEIQSTIAPNFNGQYKVMGFTHDCLFSKTQGGTRTTTVQLFIGPLLPGANIQLTDGQTQKNFDKVKGEQVVPVDEAISDSARDAYRYMQNNGGAVPPGMVTNNISWAMMVGHNNNNSDRLKECTQEVCTNCVYTARQLQEVLNKKYKGRGFKITSAWRSTRNNASCGGAVKSQHLFGKAIDFVIYGVPAPQVTQAMSGFFGFIQGYPSWTHVDTRNISFKGRSNDI